MCSTEDEVCHVGSPYRKHGPKGDFCWEGGGVVPFFFPFLFFLVSFPLHFMIEIATQMRLGFIVTPTCK